MRHALVANDAGQGAGVDPGQTDHAALGHPSGQIALRAPIGRRCRNIAEDRAAGRGHRALAELFKVFAIDADIADVGEGEGHDLSHVGRIGEDLLIAGHRRIEADLAQSITDGPDADPLKDGSIGQNQNARCARHQLCGHVTSASGCDWARQWAAKRSS